MTDRATEKKIKKILMAKSWLDSSTVRKFISQTKIKVSKNAIKLSNIIK